jgi:hypothetical protein
MVAFWCTFVPHLPSFVFRVKKDRKGILLKTSLVLKFYSKLRFDLGEKYEQSTRKEMHFGFINKLDQYNSISSSKFHIT